MYDYVLVFIIHFQRARVAGITGAEMAGVRSDEFHLTIPCSVTALTRAAPVQSALRACVHVYREANRNYFLCHGKMLHRNAVF